jgi:predicted RNA-binding Zn ribbon-like protein
MVRMHVDRAAPGDLWLVQRLVNTLDLEEGTDELSDTWVASVGLGDVACEDVAQLAVFREAVRRLLLAHNGGPVDEAAVAELDALGRSAPVAVRFGPDGVPRLEPAGALARLLAIVAEAAVAGTWERLKACPADDCHWAFYDFSRNHSRTWCDMKVCGNRAKARSYRERR